MVLASSDTCKHICFVDMQRTFQCLTEVALNAARLNCCQRAVWQSTLCQQGQKGHCNDAHRKGCVQSANKIPDSHKQASWGYKGYSCAGLRLTAPIAWLYESWANTSHLLTASRSRNFAALRLFQASYVRSDIPAISFVQVCRGFLELHITISLFQTTSNPAAAACFCCSADQFELPRSAFLFI